MFDCKAYAKEDCPQMPDDAGRQRHTADNSWLYRLFDIYAKSQQDEVEDPTTTPRTYSSKYLQNVTRQWDFGLPFISWPWSDDPRLGEFSAASLTASESSVNLTFLKSFGGQISI